MALASCDKMGSVKERKSTESSQFLSVILMEKALMGISIKHTKLNMNPLVFIVMLFFLVMWQIYGYNLEACSKIVYISFTKYLFYKSLINWSIISTDPSHPCIFLYKRVRDIDIAGFERLSNWAISFTCIEILIR